MNYYHDRLRRELIAMGITQAENANEPELARITTEVLRAMKVAYLQVVDMAEAISGTNVVPEEEIALLRHQSVTGFTVEDVRKQ